MKTAELAMITGSKIKLRDQRLADAVDDYAWRTDLELAQLDATPQLAITFPRYLLSYARGLRYPIPGRGEFAIETLDGKHIGNCTYYNVSEAKGEAELGIMIGNRDYWGKGYGADTVTTLVSYIFRQTNLNRLYLKTGDTNSRAQKCFKKCGFHPYGYLNRNGYRFVLMELHRQHWENNPFLSSSGQSDYSLT